VPDYRNIEKQLSETLGLYKRPVAISFLDAPPTGVARFEGSVPSGCSFWRIAAQGSAFYTVQTDHYNCPIGSHTHRISLPGERAAELEQTLGLIGKIGYIRLEEVPAIPQLAKTPAVVVYSPLADAPVDPDVVLFSGSPGRLMLLQEAGIRSGAAASVPLLGRPTCMALPAAIAGGVVASTGCIGNRVYTEAGDDDLYVAVAGRDVERIAREAQTIVAANATLRDYHEARRRTLLSLPT
jgi:uncharacterized protein (DUF169 family)